MSFDFLSMGALTLAAGSGSDFLLGLAATIGAATFFTTSGSLADFFSYFFSATFTGCTGSTTAALGFLSVF
jgi:hypothetical protein